MHPKPETNNAMSRLLPNRNRLIVAWLVLCAIMLRAWIPQGFMPGPIANGKPLVICSDGIYKTVLIDAQGKFLTEQKKHTQSLCPFAEAPLASPIPTAIAWQPEYIPDTPVAQRLANGVLPSHSPHIHLPRGPPELS